ncbi:MAG TPA: 50S ribosomal protein L33 [Candidatus Jacksonbacteria bacterium]|nr:50S ribosomal protein L33 [Candidatus Jacksonbacteria bacterium]HCE86214.1 50S ribosomal protein L33 [Candidatus Jacksonbacteria bacterium]
MASKKDTLIWLQCGVCKQRTYHISFSKKKETKLKEHSKFCMFCRKHTPQNQTK